jgi:hypothetical protein
MDYEKLKVFIESAINDSMISNWWIYLGVIVLSAVGGFCGSYLRKKAQNIATKEDISDITDKIEEIKAQYNKQLELYKASLQLNSQLKTAALDLRLQKHQEAYTLWRNLLFNLRKEEDLYKAIEDCQKFWENNCLYLTEEVRKAFHSAYVLAVDFKNLPREDTDSIKEWHKEITEAGKKILEAFNLPDLKIENDKD